jgi:tripartite-type tricarboxylate transporter receptor subunit TctC
MSLKSILNLAGSALALATALAWTPSVAQEFPSKPIRLIVPFAPAGITDIAARLLAQKLTERMGQQVVVENRAGGNQTIGTEYVAKSPADGYMLIMGTMGSHAVNASLRKDLKFSVKDDFAPISLVSSQPLILVVNPKINAGNLAQLIELLKANPGKYSFGSAGVGTSAHMAAELFKVKSGLSILHVPYKGSGPMLTDLIGGQIDMAFDYAPSALPQIKGGRLKALAVTGAKRADFAPELPAMAEVIPGFQVTAWQGMFAPAKTPQPVMDKLNAEIQAVMRLPDVAAKMRELGAEPVGNARDEFVKFVASEIDQWADIIRVNAIKPD